MAEKNNLRSDQESATLPSQELKRKKRVKLAIYISVFLVVQIIVITVIALTVMRVKTPNVRLGAVNVQTLNAAPATPSFDINLTTQIMVKNTNFGPYKFDASTVMFKYEDVTVGQVSIPKSKAGMRSTKKINVAVSLNSKGLPSRFNIGNVMSSGVLTLYSEVKLTGNVDMLVMKKKKSAKMSCRLEFNLSTKQIQYMYCLS